jgi:2-hydroxy-6-oxonona-2,4-dienedioate hydrolase
MLDNILPVSSRAEGLRSDTVAGKHLKPAALELVIATTLIISACDDDYGTYLSAEYTAKQIDLWDLKQVDIFGWAMTTK